MAFTPLELDGQAAAQTMLSWGTYPKYRCLQAVHEAFPFERSDAPGSYNNAIDEWNRCPSNRRHPGDRNVPAGGIVLFDLYVSSLGYSAGHIGISLGGDRFVSTDWPTYGRIGIATIGEVEDKWNATYLGWTNRVGGHTVITAANLGPRQRKVISDDVANRRIGAASTSAPLGEALAANDVGNFKGYVRGQKVANNDVWFVGDPSGDFFWSGGFVGGADISNLPDLTTSSVRADQRVVRGDGVTERKGPGTDFVSTGRTFAAGEVLDFKAWARGSKATANDTTSDIWFQGAYAEMWFSATCFTSQATDGLPEVPAPTTPSNPTPTPALDQAYKGYPRDSALAKWVGSPNYNYRDPRPAGSAPTHVTMHWMAGTLASTDAQFQKFTNVINGRGDGSASTYGVGQTEIHQYVREQDYQQADGNAESNRWGLAIEHEGGPSIPITDAVMANSAQLLADIATRYGWEKLELGVNVFPHNHWVATQCPGTLDIAGIIGRANALIKPTTPTTPTTPGGDDVPVTVGWLKGLLEAIVQAIRAFLGGKK